MKRTWFRNLRTAAAGMVWMTAGGAFTAPGEVTTRPVPPAVADLTELLRRQQAEIVAVTADGDGDTAAKLAGGPFAVLDRLTAESDAPAWQAALGRVREEFTVQRKLLSRTTDARAVEQGKRVEKALATLTFEPGPMSQKPGKPTAKLRDWMDTAEGLIVDAKRAANRERWDDARLYLRSIGHLGPNLLRERHDPKWTRWADGLIESADRGAGAEPFDAAAFKAALKNVRAQCDGCHDRGK